MVFEHGRVCSLRWRCCYPRLFNRCPVGPVYHRLVATVEHTPADIYLGAEGPPKLEKRVVRRRRCRCTRRSNLPDASWPVVFRRLQEADGGSVGPEEGTIVNQYLPLVRIVVANVQVVVPAIECQAAEFVADYPRAKHNVRGVVCHLEYWTAIPKQVWRTVAKGKRACRIAKKKAPQRAGGRRLAVCVSVCASACVRSVCGGGMRMMMSTFGRLKNTI